MYKLMEIRIGMQATQRNQLLNDGGGAAAVVAAAGDFGDVNENTKKCTHTYARQYVYGLECIMCTTAELEHQTICIK